jgi:hypothetical protein
MSTEAAEHHRKAAEHFEYAAKHHTEAANHYGAGQHEQAAREAYLARALSAGEQSCGGGSEAARQTFRSEIAQGFPGRQGAYVRRRRERF